MVCEASVSFLVFVLCGFVLFGQLRLGLSRGLAAGLRYASLVSLRLPQIPLKRLRGLMVPLSR